MSIVTPLVASPFNLARCFALQRNDTAGKHARKLYWKTKLLNKKRYSQDEEAKALLTRHVKMGFRPI